jgi:hypothetical protein
MSLYDDISRDIRVIIINSLSEYPTTPVNYSHDNGPEPSSTYASLYILSLEQVGRTQSTSRLSTDLDLEFQSPYNCTAQISFVGNDSTSIAYSSHMRLANAVLNREFSQFRNLSITSKTNIRRIPQKRDTQWVEICSFDITFFFISSFKQTIGAINQVVYEDPITEVEIAIPSTITP